MPMHQVIDNLIKQQTIFQLLYNENDYKKQENTY